MNYFFRILFVVFLLLPAVGLHAQETISTLDEVYGLDPLLYNGKRYSYFPPPETKGTQFFNGTEAVTGSIIIRGIKYVQLTLKYDLINQQLILFYDNNVDAINQLVISDAWLEAFDLDNSHFEMLSVKDTIPKIYQVLGSEKLQIAYSWRKDVLLDNGFGAINHVFSPPIKSMFLYTGTSLLKYNNNRSFISLLDSGIQTDVKKYMRKNHINVKKSPDHLITGLLKYCNSLVP
jgi:hypothetical protein